MPVMLIVHVGVFVLQCLVSMVMQVMFSQVEPHSYQHERGPDDKKRRRTLAKPENGHGRANEWSDREVGSGPRRPKMPERQHEEDQAQAVAQEAQQKRRPHA